MVYMTIGAIDVRGAIAPYAGLTTNAKADDIKATKAAAVRRRVSLRIKKVEITKTIAQKREEALERRKVVIAKDIQQKRG